MYVYSDNMLAQATMSVKENKAFFGNIDGISVLKVFVTDTEGEVVYSGSLNKKNNAINIKSLRKGLYFVTLLSEKTDHRKSFTLNR